MWTKQFTNYQKRYSKNDIWEFDVTDEALAEAQALANKLNRKDNSTTHIFKAGHNITGFICHLAVEAFLSNSPYGFSSTRLADYDGQGDTHDIYFKGDYIDVKGCSSSINWNYLTNLNCLVSQREYNNKIKAGCINKFIFCRYSEAERKVYVLGVIGKDEFENIMGESNSAENERWGKNLPEPAYFVTTSDLTPIREYL